MLTFALIFLLASFGEAYVSYEGHQVIRVVPESHRQLTLLQVLFTGNDTTQESVDFWTEPRAVGVPVDIRTVPGDHIRNLLENAGLKVTTWIDDVQDLVDRQMLVSPLAGFWEEYHSYEQINEWMVKLTQDHPELVSSLNFGESYQKRTQWAIKITSPKGGANKPILYLDAAIHSREWITTATVTWMAQQLIDGYGTDPEITVLLDVLEIIVLPIVNVDGYAYTWASNGDRMWRKTRTPNQGSSCIGTDPNRNWDYYWSAAGASSNPCSETYYGSAAFSEPCVHNVAKFMMAVQPRLKGYIAFHAYSQLWMTPWGYTTARPADYAVQNALSKACVEALTKVHGTEYVYGPIAPTIYVASGGAVDWSYGTLGVVFSATPELRDTGRYGFLLPPDQIIPSGQETFAALKVFAQALIK